MRPDEEVGSEPVPLRHTSIRLDDETRDWLAKEAARRGISESELVRWALAFVRGYLARQAETRDQDTPEGGQSA
jgi:hypothetical protein